MALPRTWSTLLLLTALAAAGCGGHRPHSTRPIASAAASTSSASTASAVVPPPAPAMPRPNAAFAPVLPLLRPAGPPLRLPTWLPAPAAGDHFYFSVKADAQAYTVDIAQAATPAAPNSLPAVPQADLLGEVAAGAPGQLGPSPADVAPATGGSAQAIVPGLTGTFYPEKGDRLYALLLWQRDGWTFEVADATGQSRGVSTLLPYARKLVAAAASPPVPGVATGTVVQTLAADNAAVWVLWREGTWEYRVQGYNAPALQLAGSMVSG